MFLIKNFLTMKHLGTIRLWNMTAGERIGVRKHVKTSNLDITLD